MPALHARTYVRAAWTSASYRVLCVRAKRAIQCLRCGRTSIPPSVRRRWTRLEHPNRDPARTQGDSADPFAGSAIEATGCRPVRTRPRMGPVPRSLHGFKAHAGARSSRPLRPPPRRQPGCLRRNVGRHVALTPTALRTTPLDATEELVNKIADDPIVLPNFVPTTLALARSACDHCGDTAWSNRFRANSNTHPSGQQPSSG